MDVAKLVDTYAKGAEHIKRMEERQATLKQMLQKALDEDGTVDDKGHRWLTAGEWMLQRQKRQAKPYLDKDRAERWAKANSIWEDVSKTVELLDEDALAGWVYDNRDHEGIQQAYDDLFVVPEPTYAFLTPQKGKQYEY